MLRRRWVRLIMPTYEVAILRRLVFSDLSGPFRIGLAIDLLQHASAGDSYVDAGNTMGSSGIDRFGDDHGWVWTTDHAR